MDQNLSNLDLKLNLNLQQFKVIQGR